MNVRTESINRTSEADRARHARDLEPPHQERSALRTAQVTHIRAKCSLLSLNWCCVKSFL